MDKKFSHSSSALSYPIRFLVVAKYLGLTLLVSIGVVLIPFLLSLAYKEYSISFRYAIVMVGLFILGLLHFALPKKKTLQANEAYVIISLTFLIGSLAMVYPFMKTGMSFIDAWFETVSGLTTTGLSVANLDQIDSKTFFFSRSWMQWYGGLGIIIFSIGLAFQPGRVTKTLVKQIFYDEDKIENSKAFAKKVLLVYCLLTIFGVILLNILGLSFFEAVEFTFSSLSTGGFSPYSDSLARFSYSIQSGIIFLSLLGAIAFPLYWFRGLIDFKKFATDVQLVTLIICGVVFTVLFTLLFSSNWVAFSPVALLNTFSLQTTAGFATINFADLNPVTKFMLMASMFIGGSTQSTAGGFKVFRLLLVFTSLRYLFFRTTLPKHAVLTFSFSKENEIPKEVITCFCLFTLYILAIFLSTLLFILYGYDPVDSLFDVVSAIGTVGASTGVTSANLPTLLKCVLGFDMLLGRLEIVTFLVIFYPKTLIGRRKIE